MRARELLAKLSIAAFVTVGCVACGSTGSHGSSAPTTVATSTSVKCRLTSQDAAELPTVSLPSQEQIKALGTNGGGCYNNVNSAHPGTSTSVATP